jgi:hypothetical protein
MGKKRKLILRMSRNRSAFGALPDVTLMTAISVPQNRIQGIHSKLLAAPVAESGLTSPISDLLIAITGVITRHSTSHLRKPLLASLKNLCPLPDKARCIV